jgi:hypothetical protein
MRYNVRQGINKFKGPDLHKIKIMVRLNTKALNINGITGTKMNIKKAA